MQLVWWQIGQYCLSRILYPWYEDFACHETADFAGHETAETLDMSLYLNHPDHPIGDRTNLAMKTWHVTKLMHLRLGPSDLLC